MMALSFFRRRIPQTETTAAGTSPSQGPSAEAEALFLRGVGFATGQGQAQDYAQAAQCYGQAAEQNHSLAQFNLAVMYAQGQGVLRDEAKSLLWMTRAAAAGDAGAQFKLGVQRHLACRDPRGEGVPEARIEALKWVRLAAAQGYRGAEGACEYVALGMTREQVAEGARRVQAFIATSAEPLGKL
jgi:TPR repeat protein